ncbi:hypothetical protein VPNG_01533 [Cytospora leucostoma]|uniref:Transmembrane protein n=1 Tax=Cytospora leucostoma TaxID=1230097 RepID=A0A423XJV5_9PEZI|nr:hypothetical protein VPNG_01533 [Cytospora leucostoma]
MEMEVDTKVLNYVAIVFFTLFFYLLGGVATGIFISKHQAAWIPKVFRTEACLAPLLIIIFGLPVIFWPVFWLGILILCALAGLQEAAVKTNAVFRDTETCCGRRRTPKTRSQQEQQRDEEAGIELPEMPASSVVREDPSRLSGPPDLPHPTYHPLTPVSTPDSHGGVDLAAADRFSRLPSREPSPFGDGQYDARESRPRDGHVEPMKPEV